MADYPNYKATITVHNNVPYKWMGFEINSHGAEGVTDSGDAPSLEQISQALHDLFSPYGFETFRVTKEVISNPQVYPPVP